MNQEEIRAFLALDLPEDVTCFLGNISNRLKQSRVDVRWVNPTSIHLTLKFLGNIIGAQIPDIETALRPIFSSQSRLQISARSPTCVSLVSSGLVYLIHLAVLSKWFP